MESEQTTFLRQITFHFQSMGLQTLVAIDSESPWHCFQAFACRNLKSLCCSIRIWLYYLSRHPFHPETGHRLRSAALHRIRFGACGFVTFVPMWYFYSEASEWSKDWAKQWALLCQWLATISRQFHWKFHNTWEGSRRSNDRLYNRL